MEKFVIDTNVFVKAMCSDDARKQLAGWQRSMAPHIHQHAVVIAEILVGAKGEEAWERWHERWVAPAERVNRIVVPSYGSWLRASRIIARLLGSGAISAGSLSPSFFNDCLLAASSLESGHTIITYNTRDFELIGRAEPAVRAIPPFP